MGSSDLVLGEEVDGWVGAVAICANKRGIGGWR